MRRTFGGLVLALALVGCSNGTSDEPASSGKPVTCDQLADEAVALSEGHDVQLLKVRGLKVDLDKQEGGWDKPTGTDETVVLRCLGAGVWSDGSDDNVRLELSVDSDGDAFVSYRATL